MGLSTEMGQFNALYKVQLGWLAPEQVAHVAASGVFRLYSFTTPTTVVGRSYVLHLRPVSISSSSPREYRIQFRTDAPDDPGLANGVELHWTEAGSTNSSTLLIDTTPGTPGRQLDAPLRLGKTFVDPVAALAVTPLAKGGAGDDAWIDVAVAIGFSPVNHAPALDILAESQNTAPGESVRFQAEATDADGDPLSFYWDFGDGSWTGNTNKVAVSWKAAGEYVVRCEVSDGRGGVSSQQQVITVGSPGTLRIAGRVLDLAGQPVANVRVHNGRVIRNDTDTPYVWSYTDSTGAYYLTNLNPGSYTNAAFLFGYRIVKAANPGPVTLSSQNIADSDFVARQIPSIAVRVEPAVVTEGDPTSAFVFTRSGPTDAPLTVPFALTGTAQPHSDYPDPFLRQVSFAVGASSISLPITTFADTIVEGPETLTLQVNYPFQSERGAGGTNVTVYFPGWELLPAPVNPDWLWYQTYPDYVLTRESSATLVILDAAQPPTLSIQQLAPGMVRLQVHGPSVALQTLEESVDLNNWTVIRTNVIPGDLTTIDLPIDSVSRRRFYRTVQQRQSSQ